MRIFSLIALSIIFPMFAYAGTLININTADKAMLESLTGIGSVKAQNIIDYRKANGPFAAIGDLLKVPKIYQSDYEKIKNDITVGDTSTTNTQNTTDTASSGVASTSSRSASTYVPPPADISVTVTGAQEVLVEVPVVFTAVVKTKGDTIDSAAQLTWSFGDGSSAVGSEVSKTYHYAGTYLVTVIATDGAAKAREETVVTVTQAAVRISAISGDGITIKNEADRRLDLSGWRLVSGTGIFRLPEGTAILPNASALFPFAVMNFSMAFDAVLTYPNGIVAARYVPPIATTDTARPLSEQPIVATTSYKQVQRVESITSSKAIVPSYAEAVKAPAAAAELAAAGAASPKPPARASGPLAGIFRSPWTLGLLGVMATAAGAFILL